MDFGVSIILRGYWSLDVKRSPHRTHFGLSGQCHGEIAEISFQNQKMPAAVDAVMNG